MSPKVSVIMPIYNVEKYLQQSLLSVMHQTLKDIEIICVNDGSTDSSLDILQYYAKKDSRIKIISTTNFGYGHAMNIGLREATGEYIGIVEPDDYIQIEMYEYLYDVAKRLNIDIVKADFYRFTRGNNKTDLFFQPVVNHVDNYRKIIEPQKEKICFRYMMNIWCGIYKSDLISKNQIWFNETPGAAFQDNGFWFQTLCYCRNIYYLDIPFYMNRRDNPKSSVNNPDNIYCCNEEYKFIRSFLRKHPELERDFLEGYMVKKYETYMFNINRVNGETLKKYLKFISDEWHKDYLEGDLKEQYFYEDEWKHIVQIMEHPEQFTREKNSYNELEQKNEELQYRIDEIQKSRSYKIGLIITAIPRKIRKIKNRRKEK
ncbi:MAG: glycosyltransferase [Blautia sp.]|uniref:glycosyltransferase family 2 protein n=1 Tax=Blautia sp. TaxID=1955243 RepID=UPI002E78E7D3|nr:glycosyltransferase [Blautia sp.]MEE1442635.1 glycosyltransferase [Blautia sp.]